jgi:hypothetical protein
MSDSMAQELAGLHRLTVPELRARYVQAFGAAPPSHHKTWLRKRLAWRLQASAEGDLSQRACARAALLAQDIVWRLAPPNDAAPQAPTPKDRNPAEHTPVVEQHQRHAHLMELDPLYCDVIVQRWQNFTGRKATRLNQCPEEAA